MLRQGRSPAVRKQIFCHLFFEYQRLWRRELQVFAGRSVMVLCRARFRSASFFLRCLSLHPLPVHQLLEFPLLLHLLLHLQRSLLHKLLGDDLALDLQHLHLHAQDHKLQTSQCRSNEALDFFGAQGEVAKDPDDLQRPPARQGSLEDLCGPLRAHSPHLPQQHTFQELHLAHHLQGLLVCWYWALQCNYRIAGYPSYMLGELQIGDSRSPWGNLRFQIHDRRSPLDDTPTLRAHASSLLGAGGLLGDFQVPPGASP
mmetsp:Transcript_52751/g.94935  ORF Transcript_52751/g.94935 Transcript_52751/m.94935 type:complete len:257 (-) Transcript_52751:84-854(-)